MKKQRRGSFKESRQKNDQIEYDAGMQRLKNLETK
jgi:hypothetical protein